MFLHLNAYVTNNCFGFSSDSFFYKEEGTVYKGRCFSWDKEKIKEYSRLRIYFALPPGEVAFRSVRILLYAFLIMNCPLSNITLTATVNIHVTINGSPGSLIIEIRF